MTGAQIAAAARTRTSVLPRPSTGSRVADIVFRALMYFAMCWPLSRYSRHLEQKLKVGHVRISAM